MLPFNGTSGAPSPTIIKNLPTGKYNFAEQNITLAFPSGESGFYERSEEKTREVLFFKYFTSIFHLYYRPLSSATPTLSPEGKARVVSLFHRVNKQKNNEKHKKQTNQRKKRLSDYPFLITRQSLPKFLIVFIFLRGKFCKWCALIEFYNKISPSGQITLQDEGVLGFQA